MATIYVYEITSPKKGEPEYVLFPDVEFNMHLPVGSNAKNIGLFRLDFDITCDDGSKRIYTKEELESKIKLGIRDKTAEIEGLNSLSKLL